MTFHQLWQNTPKALGSTTIEGFIEVNFCLIWCSAAHKPLGSTFVKSFEINWFKLNMCQLILDFFFQIVGWMDCKKSSRAGIKIGKLFGSARRQDFSDDHVPKPHNRVFDAGTINGFDYQSGCPSSLCWPLHKIHERKTSGEIFLYLFTKKRNFSGPLETSVCWKREFGEKC